jgi:hypothetical protein
METEQPGFIAETKELLEKYIYDQLLLARLEASERVAEIVSKVYIIIPFMFLLMLSSLIFTFLAGYYLSQWLGAYWMGFGIMLALYISLIFLILYLHRTRLKSKVADKVIESIFKK